MYLLVNAYENANIQSYIPNYSHKRVIYISVYIINNIKVYPNDVRQNTSD